MSSREVFGAVEEIVKRHNLDVSDALQIHTLKTMEILNLSGEGQAILVTGDEDLANAADVEGLPPWNYRKVEQPSPV